MDEDGTIGVRCYSELYILPRIFFRQTLRMPLEMGSPPGFPEVLGAYKKSENIGWETFQKRIIATGGVTQFSHIVNMSGHYAVGDNDNGRSKAPVSLKAIVKSSKGLKGNDRIGRIPVLFYERPGGLLYLPEPRKGIEEFTRDFVVDYLGGMEKFSVRKHLIPVLLRRYNELLERGKEPIVKKPKHSRKMEESDFRKLCTGTKFGNFIRGVLSHEGLDLEVAFLVPHIVVNDLDGLMGEVDEHLERLRQRGKV